MDPLIARVTAAGILELPILESQQAKGRIIHVARVATTPGDEASGAMAWIETPGGEVLRLPESLFDWAYSTVAMALGVGNPFPAQVEFGILDGRAYAEIL